MSNLSRTSPIFFVDNPEGPNQGKIDKDLPEKLRAEAEGILRWLVVGCLEYQRDGLNPPKIITDATKAYAQSADSVSQFINECCELGAEYEERFSIIYTAYTVWCEDAGVKPISKRAMGMKLKKRFTWRQSGGRIYQGFKVKGVWR